MDEYRKMYCWTCNKFTWHEDWLCIEHDPEDEYDGEEAAEEDRRINEDATYYLLQSKRRSAR